MMKFAIDAFGGDNAPFSIIQGCVRSLMHHDDFALILFGKAGEIKAELAKYDYDSKRIEIVDCKEVIGYDEPPTLAVKRKKDSSLIRAIEAVAQRRADCIVSAGNTGVLMTGATMIIKRIKGIKRPALATLLPSEKDSIMLIDCGANADCKPSYLLQFAMMGDAYMKHVVGLRTPRVALLNNGTEPEKGNELAKNAYKLLANAPIWFVGNCEAREILSGNVDVLVCDGFTGNIVLKYTEGLSKTLMSMLRNELMLTRRSKIGALLAKGAFIRFKRKMDYTEYGGAPLLGIDGCVIKAHGSSDAKAFASAIYQARKLVLADVNDVIRAGIEALPSTED